MISRSGLRRNRTIGTFSLSTFDRENCNNDFKKKKERRHVIWKTSFVKSMARKICAMLAALHVCRKFPNMHENNHVPNVRFTQC